MIPVDASLGPELVEFWSKKYRETKKELDNLKTVMMRKLSERDEILEIVRSIKKTVDDEATLRHKLEVAIKEKDELASRLARLEAERSFLSRRTRLSITQTSSLAKEAIEHRNSVVSQRFPPVNFVERSAKTTVIFTDYTAIIKDLPSTFSRDRLQFMICPPSSLPLYVPVFGQHGFWFYAPSYEPFQLIAEIHPNEWSYLGQYVSAPFPNAEMKLSEWMSLDEETKTNHCSRVASLSPGGDPVVVRQRYETGEWKIPCCSLQCVGYNKWLGEAMQRAASNLRSRQITQQQLQRQQQQQQQRQTLALTFRPSTDTRAEQSQEGSDASQAGTKRTGFSSDNDEDDIIPKKSRLSPQIILKFES